MPKEVLTNLESNGVTQVLQTISSNRAEIDAMYLHVPFCFHKCHYCDFYSIVDSAVGDVVRENPQAPPAREAAFVDRLCSELRWWAEQVELQPRTIFAGGGTPTLLQPATWKVLLNEFERLGLTHRVSEFTIEANPETVTEALFDELVAGGLNRVSIGVQSFDVKLLETLERWHDPSSVEKAVRIVRGAGIDNISVDLIFAIPGQTLAQLDADLDRALSLEPNHISAYSLIYEPNTAMTERLKQGAFEPIDESLERLMFEHVMKRLDEAGFEHYEVSNWAKRSEIQGESKAEPSRYRSEHNLMYWRNDNWLGLGPAAASHVKGHRWKNVPHIGRYLASANDSPIVDHEHLDLDQSVGEQLMMRLRVMDGVPLSWIDAHVMTGGDRDTAIEHFIQIGMLEKTTTHLRLTAHGLMVSDAVVAKLL